MHLSYHDCCKDRYQCLQFFHNALKKMMTYNIYSTIPTAPLDPQAYHLNVIQSKQQGLLKLEGKYEKKYKKYIKIMDPLVWLNACASGLRLRVASGISSVAMLSTFIGLPVSMQPGAVSLARASIGGMATALTKKHQKKLSKVMKLANIVTLVIAVFETSVSKALNYCMIDERKFAMLQTLHLKVLNELSEVDRRMGAQNRNQFEKSLLEEMI